MAAIATALALAFLKKRQKKKEGEEGGNKSEEKRGRTGTEVTQNLYSFNSRIASRLTSGFLLSRWMTRESHTDMN